MRTHCSLRRPLRPNARFSAARLLTSAAISVLIVSTAAAQNVAQWDFDGDLLPTLGDNALAIRPVPGPPAVTAELDLDYFFDEAPIDGEPAGVVAFEHGVWFRVGAGFAPNGGGAYVNQYTIIADVMFPDRSGSGGWMAFCNTNVAEPNVNEADAYAGPNGFGGAGQYGGVVEDGVWYRLAMVADLTVGAISFYVDGSFASRVTGQALDGRYSIWSINDGGLEGFSLFGDNAADNGAYVAPGFINSLQYWDAALTPPQIAALGGPHADGLPNPEDSPCFVIELDARFDAASGSVVGTWTPLPAHDGYNVLRDGEVLIADLPKGTSTFTDLDPPATGEPVTYTLQVIGGGECSVTLATFACPSSFACCERQDPPAVTLSWEPASNLVVPGYTILRDGVEIGMVSGETIGFRDDPAPSGVHTYELVPTGLLDGACAPLACVATVTGVEVAGPGPCGGFVAQWDFNGDLSASTGQVDLEPIGHPGAFDAPLVVFEDDEIDGEDAEVAVAHPGTAFVARHGLPANGGGAYVNDFTIVMDVKFPEILSWISLVQTNAQLDLSLGNDGDWFVNPTDFGIGISGVYGGLIEPETWYRLALVVEITAGTFTSFIDGEQVQQLTGLELDGRWSLYTRADATPYVILFGSDGADEMGEVWVNSVQVRDSALTAEEIAALGGPAAAGIPLGALDPPGARFVRGDGNADDTIDVTDGIRTLNFLFRGERAPDCMSAADADDTGGVNINDAVVIFNWLFLGRAAPPPPSPSTGQYLAEQCDVDPTADELTCDVEAPKCR